MVPVLRSVAKFGAQFLDGEPTPPFDARRAAHALLVPWWRRSDEPLHVRLTLAPRGAVGNGVDDSVDVVVRDGAIRVLTPEGSPEVTVDVAVADLVAARRDDAPLRARISGAAPARHRFAEQFDLTLARRR